MDRAIVLQSIADVFEDVMDVDPATISETSTGNDIEEWDSLSHVRLMIAIERKFAVRFSNAEIEAMESVRDAIDLVLKKTSA